MTSVLEEERIYAVIAKTVDTPDKKVVPSGVVTQIPGRMAAQGGHALSRMRMHRIIQYIHLDKKLIRWPDLEIIADTKVTTIWKSCRDSRELEHVFHLLDKAKIQSYFFEDENPDVYGYWHPRTALATVPTSSKSIVGILDYLPLWKPEEK
jgi:hypothetical protein